MREGIERESCPVCGGQIVVSDFWMFSYDRLLGKHGKLLKKRTRSTSGPMECQTAYCLDCKEAWNADEFMIDEEDRFVDFKDRGNG
jgi:rRNA maturation protein Nop10